MNNDVIGTFSQKEYNEKYDVIMNKYKMDMKYIIRTAIVGFPILIAYDIFRICRSGHFFPLIYSRFDASWWIYFPLIFFTGYVIRKIQITKRRKKKALEELEQKKNFYMGIGKFEL